MVFKKKKGCGVNATGRDAAAPEELTFSNLDPDEKRECFKEHMHMQHSRAGCTESRYQIYNWHISEIWYISCM